jgi:CheY-like chemotaxis protein
MLDHEEIKWIAATSTELNSMLQQIARYTDLARGHKGEHGYLDLLAERVDLASKTAQSLFDRVTSKILASASQKSAAALKGASGFRVVPPPSVLEPSLASMAVTTRQDARQPAAGRGRGGSNGKGNEAQASNGLGLPAGVRVKNPKGNREYILFIEDEPEVAEVASELLAEEGYRVILARDGFEALKIYAKAGKQIGLVILDFFLPVMDGDAVFDELRAINPKVNVVLSSGFAEQHKIASMLEQGLRGFIPKPYTREKLLEQVRSTLDAARQASH